MKRCGLYLLGFLLAVSFAVVTKWSQARAVTPPPSEFLEAPAEPVSIPLRNEALPEWTLLEIASTYSKPDETP